MNQLTAHEIVDKVLSPPPGMMDAIKLLRENTSMGLMEAKTYLEQGVMMGPRELLNHLMADFVQNPADLLVQAKAERKRLDLYIQQLESEIEHSDTPVIHNVFTDKREG